MDIIEKIDESIIQHGKHNDRIYLMKLDTKEPEKLLSLLEDKAKKNNYSKIFAKIPACAKDVFLENGYVVEAYIPNMYKGKEDVFFMAKYYKKWRSQQDEGIIKVLEISRAKESIDEIDINLDKRFHYRVLDKNDAKDMVEVYKQVFKTYPFPIHDYTYLQKTMDENFVYFGIFLNNKLVGLSSSEMDNKGLNVEMTDFATLPEFRGNGFAIYLLNEMEKEMRKRGIKTAFTIVRAKSFGMNITFAKKGYTYSGTLIKNTNIAGEFETMNVWYKSL
ncbi:MAG: putative beta-lysine N-acetyltransferase [Eubacteriales bacterium]